MNNVKTWWTSTGWPWLKGNWWVLLLLPLMAIVAVGMFMMRFAKPPVIIDPTEKADERARLEAETRADQLEAEKARLALQLAVITAERDELRDKFEARLRDEVDALRDDPEKLREMMLSTGPGRRP